MNLHGAPYDWRLAPDGHNGGSISAFYPRMKALIEQTVLANGGLAAHLITHSLGGPTVLAFLNGQSHAWIEQNVASFIPIAGKSTSMRPSQAHVTKIHLYVHDAGPWGGSTEMLLSQVSGFTFGIPGAPYHYLHRFQASAASGALDCRTHRQKRPSSIIRVRALRLMQEFSYFQQRLRSEMNQSCPHLIAATQQGNCGNCCVILGYSNSWQSMTRLQCQERISPASGRHQFQHMRSGDLARHEQQSATAIHGHFPPQNTPQLRACGLRRTEMAW
eukprot:SAG31_NODE_1086_length_9998_cov_2.389837_5_plen_274_part_00